MYVEQDLIDKDALKQTRSQDNTIILSQILFRNYVEH